MVKLCPGLSVRRAREGVNLQGDAVGQELGIDEVQVVHRRVLAADSEEHRRLTGVPNEQILDNIRHVYHDLKVPVIIRVPTIPGYNDSAENILATAEFAAKELGKDVAVHLLPYHRLGESKNESLGKDMNLGIEVPSDEHMQALKAIVEGCGLTAQVGG